MKIACAPCCWGVENEENPNYPKWEKVLLDMLTVGMKGVELGPYGFFPTDKKTLLPELNRADISIIAGTIYDDLVDSSEEYLQQRTRKVCSLLSDISAEFVVIIDAVNAVRSPYSGLPEQAPRLTVEKKKKLITNLKIMSKISREEFGIRPTLHNHAGGYIEFEDEINAVLEALTNKEIGLCIDLGHIYYSKMDPCKKLIEYKDRIDYIHFKDVVENVYLQVTKDKIGYFEACAKGVMCEIGNGTLDYPSIFKTLKQIGYIGWCTIEQERDPIQHEKTASDLRRSLAFCQKYAQK